MQSKNNESFELTGIDNYTLNTCEIGDIYKIRIFTLNIIEYWHLLKVYK